jgi:hypothetical protein
MSDDIGRGFIPRIDTESTRFMHQKTEKMSMTVVDLNDVAGDVNNYGVDYADDVIDVISGTRAEDALRAILDTPDDMFTLEKWGDLTKQWIDTHKQNDNATTEGRQLITANDIQLKLGRSGAIRQIEAARPNQDERTVVTLSNNGELAEEIKRILDTFQELSPRKQGKELARKEYWQRTDQRHKEMMKYISAAGDPEQRKRSPQTPNLCAEVNIEAELYSIASTQIPDNTMQFQSPVVDINIRKFARRREDEEEPQWLKAFKSSKIEGKFYDNPRGMGRNYAEYVILVDICSDNLGIDNTDSGLNIIHDGYAPYLKKYIGLSLYDGTSPFQQLRGIVKEAGPDEHRWTPPRWYSDVVVPDTVPETGIQASDPDAVRLLALYQFGT